MQPEDKPFQSPMPQLQSGARRLKIKRGQGAEAQRVGNRLAGFNDQSSEAWRVLRSMFGEHHTHSELKSVAQVACAETGLLLDRDACRDNRVLIKWFHDNWSQLARVLPAVRLLDQNYESLAVPAPPP
jgi:hypothetical protein